MSHLYEPCQDSYDAFGRLRVSNPLTLFDSSHRYRDNNLWTSLVVGSGSTVGFVTPQIILESSKKLIDVFGRKVAPDDRDNVVFSKFLGPEDYIKEHISWQQANLLTQMM